MNKVEEYFKTSAISNSLLDWWHTGLELNSINTTKEWRFPCVYLLINMVNNKIYIGQTICLGKRVQHYKLITKSTQEVFRRALSKYGPENFRLTVLESVPEIEKLDEREQYYIDVYQPYRKELGYNVCLKASSPKGIKRSSETRLKLKARVFSAETRIKQSVAASNRIVSEQTKLKISQTRIKKKVIQLDMEDTEIHIFSSIAEAAAFVGCHQSSISAVCRKVKGFPQAKGFKWKFYNE